MWADKWPRGLVRPPREVRKEREFPLISRLEGRETASLAPEPLQTQKEREFPLY